MDNFQEQFVKSRQNFNGRLTERALEDSAFREALRNDPRGALAAEFGITVPDDRELVVVEETASRQYVVLPPASLGTGTADELDETQLDAVAGGGREILWTFICWGDGSSS